MKDSSVLQNRKRLPYVSLIAMGFTLTDFAFKPYGHSHICDKIKCHTSPIQALQPKSW